MLSKIYNFLQILKSSLWLVPFIFCMVYACATLGVYWVERTYLSGLELPVLFFNGPPEHMRSLAETLLSAMITMTTLSISITIVVLSLAASQFGPRLIRIFMADRKTQDFIGLFFGTVVACFIMTLIVQDASMKDFAPRLTMSFIYAICFINLFVLLFFVHHVAQASIADNITLKVSRELRDSIQRIASNYSENFSHLGPQGKSDWPENFEKNYKNIAFSRSGYVQAIDYEGLGRLARQHDLRLKIAVKPGSFIVEDTAVIAAYPGSKIDEDMDKSLQDYIIIGQARTPTQDLEYSVRHLVEIAIRALSPGINDSFTAMNVVDQLTGALSDFFDYNERGEWFWDEDGCARLNAPYSKDDQVVFSALNQIRENAQTNPSVLRYMIDKVEILAERAKNPRQIEGLREQATALQKNVEAITFYLPDRKDLLERVGGVIKAL